MYLPERKLSNPNSAYQIGWNDCLEEILYNNPIISLDKKNMSEENIETPVETPEITPETVTETQPEVAPEQVEETPAQVEETPETV